MKKKKLEKDKLECKHFYGSECVEQMFSSSIIGSEIKFFRRRKRQEKTDIMMMIFIDRLNAWLQNMYDKHEIEYFIFVDVSMQYQRTQFTLM